MSADSSFRVEHFLHSQQLGIYLLSRKETQKIFALFLPKDFLNFPAGSSANPRPPRGEGRSARVEARVALICGQNPRLGPAIFWTNCDGYHSKTIGNGKRWCRLDSKKKGAEENLEEVKRREA